MLTGAAFAHDVNAQLKERLKLWDYFVSNEVVQLAQGSKLGSAGNSLWESYLKGELFFEIVWELNILGKPHQFVAVIERPKERIEQIDITAAYGCGDLDARRAREYVFYYLNRSVFVDDIELMENP